MIVNRKLSDLVLVSSAQPREKIDMHIVGEYEAVLKEGGTLPPIVVFGKWVADGFHRWMSYQGAGLKVIPTITHQGGERQAILYSCRANATHGLRRTSADKRRAVLKMVKDPEWGKWTDRRIAVACAVEHHMVADLRRAEGHPRDTERLAEREGTEFVCNLRPEPNMNRAPSGKRILAAISLLANSDATSFDQSLSEPQRKRLHDDKMLLKARTFLDSL